MNRLNKNFLTKLYNKGFSIQEIADKLKINYHTFKYYFGKYKIPRRSWSEATYVKRNPNGDPFKIKKKLNQKEVELKGLGLGLFWGEGCHTNRFEVKLGNTDPMLIKKFIEFLERICGVKRKKLRFQLQIFSDVNPKEAFNFWLNNLKVPVFQFTKTIVTPSRGKGTYKKKCKYGVLTASCHNTKLKKALDEMLRKYWSKSAFGLEGL